MRSRVPVPALPSSSSRSAMKPASLPSISPGWMPPWSISIGTLSGSARETTSARIARPCAERPNSRLADRIGVGGRERGAQARHLVSAAGVAEVRCFRNGREIVGHQWRLRYQVTPAASLSRSASPRPMRQLRWAMVSPVAMLIISTPMRLRNRTLNTSIARCGVASCRVQLGEALLVDRGRARRGVHAGRGKARCARAAPARHPAPAARWTASDSSQSVSGSASGSLGNTETFGVMRGSTWSPEISTWRAGQ